MAGELSGRSYNAGLSLERRLGSLSAFVRPVEVGIEADDDQTVFLRRHILIGIIEIEPELLTAPGETISIAHTNHRIKPNTGWARRSSAKPLYIADSPTAARRARAGANACLDALHQGSWLTSTIRLGRKRYAQWVGPWRG